MIEQLGIDGLVSPDDEDADIRDELVFGGREATFGFDTIGGIFGRPSSLAMWESCPNCAGMHNVLASRVRSVAQS